MKKALVPILMILILVVIDVQTLSCWAEEFASPPATDAKKEAPPEAGAAKGEGGEEGAKAKKPSDVLGGRFAGDPIYVRLQPIVLPILGNTGPEQLVTIQITVQVKDFDTADDMHAHMPRVMDALIQALYGGLSSGDLRNGRLADVSKIKSKTMSALQAVQGVDSIKDVLIANLSQRLL